jgi:DnaJ-class molecular chaperone
MQRQPTPALAPGDVIRTLCPNCFGTGRIASDRATHSNNLGVLGRCQTHPCPTCHGQRWLAGLQSPV